MKQLSQTTYAEIHCLETNPWITFMFLLANL